MQVSLENLAKALSERKVVESAGKTMVLIS
ncbi:hypothetical protein HKBW3S42_00345, partial [Candidatus Hakubella thermalkaliphila]